MHADFNYDGLSSKKILADNSIIYDLIKSQIFNNSNLNVNLNVNLDPDLLSKLGLVIGTDGNLENLNENFNNKKQTNNDLLIGGDEPNITGGRGDVSDMLEKGANNPNCSSCKLPEKYIKKDLVKSMCIGCDNIDNVLT